VPNSIVQAFRAQYPQDARSDDELTLAIGTAYPEYADPTKFPDFHNDLQRLTRAAAPQPTDETPPELIFPPSIGDYPKQMLGSGIRSFSRTLSAIPEFVGSAARIAGTYSVPGAEHVPMRFETEPGGLETSLARAGEAVAPEPVPGLEQSFIATQVPGAVASGAAMIVGGGVANLATRGIVRSLATSAFERAVAGGMAETEALTIGKSVAEIAARRLSYANIAGIGALSQAQQGYEEAKRAGADEETRMLSMVLNLPVGMTEAVPLAKMLNKLDGLSGGTLKHALLEAGKESFEEVLQNSFQGVAGNIIASRIAKYEPDRKIFDGLAEDAASGGIAGAILSLATSAIGGKLGRAPGERTTTGQQPPPPAGAAGAGVVPPPAGTPPAGPAGAAADVATQYETPEQRAQRAAQAAAVHSSRMLEVARRFTFGGFGTSDIAFVGQLSPSDMAIYQGLVEQAGKERDATSQRIEQQNAEEERRRNDALLRQQEADRQREAEEQKARAASGVGGSVPAAAPVGAVTAATVPAAVVPAAPVVVAPVVVAAPVTSSAPVGTGGQPVTAPEKNVVATPPSLVPTGTDLPPALEAIAVKVADPKAPLPTPEELALVPKIPSDPFFAAYVQRLGELRGILSPVVVAKAQPTKPKETTPKVKPVAERIRVERDPETGGWQVVEETWAFGGTEKVGESYDPFETEAEAKRYAEQLLQKLRGKPPEPKPTRKAVSPVAPVKAVAPAPAPTTAVAKPKPAKPVVPLPPLVKPTLPPEGTPLTKARAIAIAMATAVQRKVAAVIHQSEVVDTIDFEGDSPLVFGFSGQGVGERNRLAKLDKDLVLIQHGQHEGYVGKVDSTGTQVTLQNGDVVKVESGEYKRLVEIRKEMMEGTGEVGVLAPAYFELATPPAANDKALAAAGLVSRASFNGEVDHGSRVSWTHRWTVFRDGDKVWYLPTYRGTKKEGYKVFAMEVGNKKGTPVTALMARGFVPIASFRTAQAQHAREAVKVNVGADEHEATFAKPAREQMGASARTAAAVAAASLPTAGRTFVEGEEGDETAGESLPASGFSTTPGAVARMSNLAEKEVVEGTGDAVVRPHTPLEIVFSKKLGIDMFDRLTRALAQSPKPPGGGEVRLNIQDEVTFKTIVTYVLKGKYGNEIKELVRELASDIGEAEASRAVLAGIVGAYNDSRTSEEFAEAISRSGGRRSDAAGRAAAAGGVGGSAVPARNRGVGAGQPGAAVQPATGNAGVATPVSTVTGAWARGGKLKLRRPGRGMAAGLGEGETSLTERAAYEDLIDTAQDILAEDETIVDRMNAFLLDHLGALQAHDEILAGGMAAFAELSGSPEELQQEFGRTPGFVEFLQAIAKEHPELLEAAKVYIQEAYTSNANVKGVLRTGTYTSPEHVRAKLQRALENLAAAGFKPSVFQARLDDLLDHIDTMFSGPGSGSFDPNTNAIWLVLADIAQPSNEEFFTAMHEGVHAVASRESQQMQIRMHRAINALSDAALGLTGTAWQALESNPARLDFDTLMEERLAESLAREDFDPIAAATWSQRIMRLLKDIYNRLCMALQSAFFGEKAINPERVVEYYRNRLRSLVAGDPSPRSFIEMLGGKKPSLERAARFYYPVADAAVFHPVVVNWEEGRVYIPIDAAASVAAVQANIANAARPDSTKPPFASAVDVLSIQLGDMAVNEGRTDVVHPVTGERILAKPKFRRPGYVAEGEPVGGENPTIRGGWLFAAANGLLDSLQKGFAVFNHKGYNPIVITGTSSGPAVTFDNFLSLFQGDLAHPEAMKAGVQEQLTAMGEPTVNPDLNIDGAVTFQSDAVRKQAIAMKLNYLNQWLSQLNERFATETNRKTGITNTLARTLDRAEKFLDEWQNLNFHFIAAKEAIADQVAEAKDNIREGIGLAKHVGMLVQSLREYQAKSTDPLPTQYRQLIEKMQKRIFDNATKFTAFLERVSVMNIDWHGQTLPQIKEQLSLQLDTDPFFVGLSDDEKNVALALVASFARSNDHQMSWLALKATNDYEARDAIRDMLSEARKDTTAALNSARNLVPRVARRALQAQRILDHYIGARKKAQAWQDDLARNTRILQAHDAAAPMLAQEVRALEKELGGSRPVPLIDGAKLPMVTSPTDTAEQISANTPWVYRDYGNDKATPTQVAEMKKRYQDWIDANAASGGAMVETLRDLVQRLDLVDANKAAVGMHQGFLAQAFGSLSDAAVETGSAIAQRIGQALRRYAFLEGSYTKELVSIGRKAGVARARAMDAMKVRDVNYFMQTFHDGGFGYFEKRKDLQERPDAREAALSGWRASLQANPATNALITPESWTKLRDYYLRCVEFNQAQVRIAKEMGIKIKDENLGMFRDPIGDPLFTMPRGLNIEDMFLRMREHWNGVKTARMTAEGIAQQFTDDPAALQAAVKDRFSTEVWQDFVGGMVSRDGRSLFSGREWAPGKWTIASIPNVKTAYEAAHGDPILFAVTLHSLEGNTPDTRAAFVGETLETFQNYFDSIEKIMNDTEGAANKYGLQRGVPRFLMDARVSEDFPTSWLRYQHIDEHHAQQAIHRFAFHSAFGRNGDTVAADFDGAIKELNESAQQWNRYMRKAREDNPTMKPHEIVQVARDKAKSEGKSVKLLENAGRNVLTLRKTEEQLAAWFKSHAEDTIEPRVFLEMLSFVTSMLVQGPKTAVINTMDLTGGPVIQYGLTASSLNHIRNNWAQFAGSAFGSLFQTFGVQMNWNVVDRLKMLELGLTDPDNQTTLTDRFISAVRSVAPGGTDIKGRLGQAAIKATRVARLVTSVGLPARGAALTPGGGEGLFPTLKAAPFSMISRWMNEAMILANWGRFRGFVGKAIEYLHANPSATTDPDFQFTADMLGYKKGYLFDEAHSFEALKEAMNRWGMSLENVAKNAMKPGAPMFTDDQHRALAEMALEEMSLEASPNTAPRWSGSNYVGRFAMPLLRWSFARTNQIRKTFNEPNGEKNWHAVMSGLKAMALATGVGIGYGLLMGKWDEELTGKKSNIRGFGQDNNFLAAIEMTARMGTLGLWGDVANTLGNYAGTGDLRGLSLDNRVVFVNSLINTMSALTTWVKQGDATYATVYRQLLQALGGSGYLQIAQIVNHELSLDNAETRVVSRINIGNWLRAAGRELNMDVRIGRAAGAVVNANSIKPWIGEMVLAALADDQADFILAYSKAVDAAREEGKPDAVKHVQMSYAAYNPLRTVFQTPPTEAEYAQLLTRLPPSGRADVQVGILLFNKYANSIGVKEYEGKVEKAKKPPGIFDTPRPKTSEQARRQAAMSIFR
jgi:hypothetical protein